MSANVAVHSPIGPGRRARRVRPAPAMAAVLLALAATAAVGQAVEPPIREAFDGSALGDPWVEELGPGGAIEVKDGWATFRAPDDRRCHAARPAGADRISVTGRLARWAGIYLVWGPDDWCGVGKVSPTPFGRLYSIDVRDGEPTEVNHRGIDFNAPHRLRIRLGEDHVAFQYELDGRWADLRTIERPEAFSGAPRLVAVGKSYGAEDHPFGDARADEPGGAEHSGAIDEVTIEATPEAELSLTEADLEAIRRPPVEPVNALLRRGQDDPTYEQIVGYYPPFRYPREVVGVPEHPQEIGVDWLGRLDASPWAPPKAWFLIGDPAVPFGEPGVPFRRRLLHGDLPLVTIGREIDGVDHELTVFGWSEDFRADGELYAYARFSSRSADAGRLPTQVALAWGEGDRRLTMPLEACDGRAEAFLRFRWPDPSTACAITATEYDAKFRETAARWRERLAPAGRFDVPDPRVMEAYRAWVAYSMLDADTIDGRLEPHDGSGFYDSMFGHSVSLQAVAMDQYGLHDYAAKILAMQCHFQRPDGLYLQDCGLVDAGAFLAGLAKHFELTGDRDWLRSITPNLVRQCDWIVRERGASPKDGILRGLIKFRPYNDYPEPVYNYLGNAWCARGMALAATALDAAGDPRAEAYAAEADRYRRDLLDSMKASAFPHEGMTLLPMEPDTRRLLKLGKNQGGGYWGLIASPLLETELLAADDVRAGWIVDALERRGGLIAGVCEFQGGIDHAYTFGYLNHALRRDEVGKAILGFWSFLAFGMTRDTYSPVEVSMIATGENHLTLPHLYSCTEQLRLLRNLLVREDGDTLWLGQGVPRAWLEPGRHVAVTAAPTDFGDVSYRIDAHDDGTMRVALDPPTRRPPSEIRLRLRHPRGGSIAAVTATPATNLEHAGDSIVLRGLDTPIDLQITFSTP